MTFHGRMFVIKALYQAKANADLEARGFGPNNLGVPLSALGVAPATHYGCQWQGITDAELDSISEVLAPLRDAGHLWSYNTDSWDFERVLSDRGLKRISPVI